jgi:hypothetical protein
MSVPASRPTVRDVIAQLEAAARNLPDGLDTPTDLAICDGHNQQFVDRWEVTWQHTFDTSGQLRRTPETCALILGHAHHGESPGRVSRGIAGDVDEELRGLVEGDEPGS